MDQSGSRQRPEQAVRGSKGLADSRFISRAKQMSKSYGGDFSSYRLYRADGTHTLISRDAGGRLVRRKLAQEGTDTDGVTLCFLSLKVLVARAGRRRTLRRDTDSSEETCRTFSRNEVLAIAGRHFKHGRSRTAQMSEA